MYQRYQAIDLFRGLTIVLMILVNSLDSASSFTWLVHSSWDGCTLADLVFPFFLIAVGISAVLKYSHYQAAVNFKLFKRTLFLILLGVALNAFPRYWDLEHLRFLGVLQRIAICYCVCSFLCLHTTSKFQALLIPILLLAYWRFNLVFPTTITGIHLEHCHENSIGCIDQLLFSSNHLYQTHFDPEGIMTTIPAIATTLIGNWIGYRLLSTESKLEIFFSLFAVGSLCALLGYCWNFIYPMNKSLWTGSFVLWTGGLGLITCAACILITEYPRNRYGFIKPLEKLGQHSLIIFVLHVLGLKLQYAVHLHSQTLHRYILSQIQQFSSPPMATLYFGLSYTLLWLMFAQILPRHRKRV